MLEESDVPVDPDLSNCFNCLEIINEFRYSNDPALIDELIARWNNHEETSSFSSQAHQRTSNEDFERDLLVLVYLRFTLFKLSFKFSQERYRWHTLILLAFFFRIGKDFFK